MTVRRSKRYPISFHDKVLEELEFCRRIEHQAQNPELLEPAQAAVREIVYRYGYNPAKYPSYVAYTFWAIITGDWWGVFKRKVIQEGSVEILDPSDPHIVEYSC